MPRTKTKTRTTFPPKLAAVEKALGPAREWAGRCYEIATALVEHGFVDGVAVYGHWIGKVEPQSYFGLLKRGAPFVQHGWVQVQGNPNLILDPTRWAFTGEDPFLYFGPNNGEYDEGGNTWRKALRGACPQFDSDEGRIHIFTKRRIASAAWTHVEKLLGANYLIALDGAEIGSLTYAQLSWLANSPYDDLQPFAREIYAAIDSCGQRALIPIDNYRRAERR